MTDDPRDRNCLPPVCSEVRYMTMILEKQELFTPVFSEVRYMTDDHRE